MTIRYRTEDSPNANGREPLHGEQKWNVMFPLEDGETLVLEIGRKGRESLLFILRQDGEDESGKKPSSGEPPPNTGDAWSNMGYYTPPHT